MEKKLIFIVGAFFESEKPIVHHFNLFSFIDQWEDERGIYFCGVLIMYDNALWYGTMKDKYGASSIVPIKLDNSCFEFSKRYHHRKDVINYTFRKERELWVGSYNVEEVDSGFAICKLIYFDRELQELNNLIIISQAS